MLLGVRIQNFEILQDLSIGLDYGTILAGAAADRQGLMELSAVIGRNSAGKTSFIKGLHFLADCIRKDAAEASTAGSSIGFVQLKTQGSREPMAFELTVLSPELSMILVYRLEIQGDRHMRPEIQREEAYSIKLNAAQVKGLLRSGRLTGFVPEPEMLLNLEKGKGQAVLEGQPRKAAVSDQKQPALSSYGRILDYPELVALYSFISRWFFCRFSEAEAKPAEQQHNRQRHLLQLEKGKGEHRHLTEDGSNVANVLAYLKSAQPDFYHRLIEDITRRIPHGRDVITRLRNGEAGSGEEKLFAYFLLLADPEPRSCIFMENPDFGLYYNMVYELAKAMREYTLQDKVTQLLLTTHSQNLVDSLAPHELWVLYREENNGHGTKAISAARLPFVTSMYQEGIGLGSLWYSGHLDPAPAETPAQPSDGQTAEDN